MLSRMNLVTVGEYEQDGGGVNFGLDEDCTTNHWRHRLRSASQRLMRQYSALLLDSYGSTVV
jgi:hypothetical protein